MARAAGVSEVSEVIERFRTQKQTYKVLEDQQAQSETDVRVMGIQKEELDKEFVEVRFEFYYSMVRLVCMHYIISKIYWPR